MRTGSDNFTKSVIRGVLCVYVGLIVVGCVVMCHPRLELLTNYLSQLKKTV